MLPATARTNVAPLWRSPIEVHGPDLREHRISSDANMAVAMLTAGVAAETFRAITRTVGPRSQSRRPARRHWRQAGNLYQRGSGS